MNFTKNNQVQYEEAVKRVKKIKGFYFHLMVYLGVNALIIGFQLIDDTEKEPLKDLLELPFIWGIGLAAHAASVFLPEMIFGQNWEKKKINELIEQEKNNTKSL